MKKLKSMYGKKLKMCLREILTEKLHIMNEDFATVGRYEWYREFPLKLYLMYHVVCLFLVFPCLGAVLYSSVFDSNY